MQALQQCHPLVYRSTESPEAELILKLLLKNPRLQIHDSKCSQLAPVEQSKSSYTSCDMQVVICPGIHPPALTAQFVQAIPLPTAWIYPAPEAPAYSGGHILAFLLRRFYGDAGDCYGQFDIQRLDIQSMVQTPLLLIGFSAGVVGAITAADLWQALGGRVVALIAVDGWGMPLRAMFPVHRFSHDPFTHWSSALLDEMRLNPTELEAESIHFYADPPVGHLNLWRAPQVTQGWAVSTQGSTQGRQQYLRSNAADLLRQIIAHYQCESENQGQSKSRSLIK